MPSIMFTPQNGAEHATSGGGPVMNSSWGMPIYTIFWGSYWATSAGQSFASQIEKSLNSMLYFSPYLNSLSQYGVNYPAGVNGAGTVQVFDYSDPGTPFSGTDVYNEAVWGINGLGLPTPNQYSNKGVYFVITAPGAQYNQAGVGGYHTYGTENGQQFNYGWIGTDGSLDDATYIISHEVVETLTDPHGNAWQVDPRSSSAWNEIGDNEAQNYTYRINGYMVQSYWSQIDGYFKVDDGNSQNFYVNNGTLYVYGDQFGSGYNDTITIDTNWRGGVYVNLNGQVASFDPGQISSIQVYTFGGSNSVYVNNEAFGVPLTINDGGYDYVHVGSGGSVQGIWGTVNISNPSYYTNLVIDDSADTVARTVSMSSTYVSGLAPAGIYFHFNDLSYLTVYGGSGGNTFYVYNTPSTYTGSSPGYTWLNSGNGNDIVDVFGTAGGSFAGGLYVYGNAGQDSVSVGAGSLANVNNFVSVSNAQGSTYLYVDDSADTVARSATLNSYSLTGLSGGPIYYTPTASATGGVTLLAIYGPAAGSTFTVNDTPSLYYYTSLQTGAGSDTVFVNGTTGALYVYNSGGQDYVYVGNGTLGAVNGFVYVYGAGSTYLYVQDGSDATSRTATLNGYSLSGLSNGLIEWSATSSSAGGVTFLDIFGPTAGSIFDVVDTPNLFYYTSLNTGTGNDAVNITGTTGGLNVYNYGGSDSVVVGSNAPSTSGGTVAGIDGYVNVYGAGSTSLVLDDSGDATARTVSVVDNEVFGLAPAPIFYGSGVVSLTVNGGTAGDTFDILSTLAGVSTVLNGGLGNDAFLVTPTSQNLDAIAGALTLNGGGGTADKVTVNDQGSAATHTYNLTGSSLGRSGAATIFYSLVESFLVNGGSGGNAFVLAALPTATAVTLSGGSGTNTLTGPNADTSWTISSAGGGKVGTVTFSKFANLVGGNGVDVFKFTATGSLAGTLNGGGAPPHKGDWLDYSGLTTAVTVNLQTGAATKVAGGVSNIEDVHGGNGGNTLTGNALGNILIGGTGNDTLIGGSGASILIGDKGADKVTGGSGNDILIGDYTTFDTMTAANEAALMAILAEWQSADSYATRFHDINTGTGGGLNGTKKLNFGTTVLSDGAVDTVTGVVSAQALDWFFKGAGDVLKNVQSGEHVNNT
jgi:hypothetical protein